MNRPGAFINVITFDRRVRWPDGVTSLDHFRTVAFERSMMRATIRIGHFPVRDPMRPWVKSTFGMDLSTWIAVVPECYREKVSALSKELFDSTLKNQLYKEWMLDQFIEELRGVLYEKLEPIMPGDVP